MKLSSLRRHKTTLSNIFPHGKQKLFPMFKIALHQLPGGNKLKRSGLAAIHTTEKNLTI